MADDRIIGITMRIVEANGYAEPRDALAQNMIAFVQAAFPYTKFLLLPNLGVQNIPDYCKRMGVNRFIFSGGDDPNVTPLRDESEFSLMKYAEQNKFPVLGICRGMQMMGQYFGMDMTPVENHVRTRHVVAGDDIRQEVNSYHNYALKDCPEVCDIIARSQGDDAIEAIRHKNLPWQGWMWHPEREDDFATEDMDRLRRLFQ